MTMVEGMTRHASRQERWLHILAQPSSVVYFGGALTFEFNVQASASMPQPPAPRVKATIRVCQNHFQTFDTITRLDSNGKVIKQTSVLVSSNPTHSGMKRPPPPIESPPKRSKTSHVS